MFLRTLILDCGTDCQILACDCRIVENIWRAARQRRMLTHKVEIVEIAADVIPKPVASSIENHTILFAVVVVRLILAPCRLHNDFTC